MVEDYTTAFFVTLFVVVFMALCTIWALWGLITALGAGLVADRLIGRPSRRL